MVQVTVAVPRTDGYEEFTTFEYESLKFDPHSDEITEDFTILVEDGAGGRPVVNILALVFDDDYGGAMPPENGDLHNVLENDLSKYVFDEMRDRLDDDDVVGGSISNLDDLV